MSFKRQSRSDVPIIKRSFPIGRGVLINLLFGFVIYYLSYIVIQDNVISLFTCAFTSYIVSGFIFYDVKLFKNQLIYYYPTRLLSKKNSYDNINIEQVKYTNGGHRGVPYFIIFFSSDEKRFRKTISIDSLSSIKYRKKLIDKLANAGIKVIEV